MASGVTYNFRNQDFAFPEGTTCRRLSITRSGLINSDDYWYCRYRSGGSIEKYEFFPMVLLSQKETYWKLVSGVFVDFESVSVRLVV